MHLMQTKSRLLMLLQLTKQESVMSYKALSFFFECLCVDMYVQFMKKQSRQLNNYFEVWCDNYALQYYYY